MNNDQIKEFEKITGKKVGISNGNTLLDSNQVEIPESDIFGEIPSEGQYAMVSYTCGGACTIGKPETRCKVYHPSKCNAYSIRSLNEITVTVGALDYVTKGEE